MVTFQENQLIISADYDYQDDGSLSSCLVIYADGSNEHVTTDDGLNRVQKQIEAQAKSFLSNK